MSSIDFDLAVERGGPYHFDDLAEAILWAQQQELFWQGRVENVTPNFDHVIASPWRKWKSLANELQASYKKGVPVTIRIEDDPSLIVDDSPTSSALYWVLRHQTIEGIAAAFAVAVRMNDSIDWTSPAQVNAVLLFERVSRNWMDRNAKSLQSNIEVSTKSIEKRIADALSRLLLTEEHVSRLSKTAEDVESRQHDRLSLIESGINSVEALSSESLNRIQNDLNSASDFSKNEIGRILEHSNERLDNWFQAFKEQSRLEAPVALWEARAATHELSLVSRMRWMVGVGIFGLVGSIAVAFAGFKFAKNILSDAVILSSRQAIINIPSLRPSFHFEMIISGAGTLIYLTMYLWAMRLLVRLYTTEHHLALDARGRAALTETYLSLTKEGAATDADRALMLSVIFRPVSDGMVKEEGPPTISPATLMASLATGSNK